MSSGSATRFDRRWVVQGLWLGLLLLSATYLGLGEVPLPYAMRAVLARSDLTLWGLLVLPTAVLLLAGTVAAVRHRDHTRWITMAIGAAVAAAAVVLTVLAAMGVIALIVAQGS